MGLIDLWVFLQKITRFWFFSGLGKILFIGLTSRLLVFVSAIVGSAIIGTRPALPGEGLWDVDLPVVNLFSRWDGGLYANIALNGYPAGNNPVSGLWCMFPLYPFLMRVFGALFYGILTPFQSVLFSGFLLSNSLFFLDLVLFYKVSEKVLMNQKLATISVAFFSFWSGSLFYSCIYSESLFMAFALGAFYFLETEKLVKSSVLGTLAGSVRSNGFLIFVPFLYNGLQKRNWRAVFQLIPLFVPYLLFNLSGYFLTGLFPVREIAYEALYGKPVFLLSQLLNWQLGYTLLFSVEILLVLVPFVWFLLSEKLAIRDFFRASNAERKDIKYWAFSLVILLMILFYSFLANVDRYAVPILPLYWVNAVIWDRHQKLGKILLLIMATILAVGSILFSTWRIFW